MISSRWPRPIGISESIAFSPVAIGSCTDLRGMMPGALTSTRRALVGLDRALAVDRIAERVDHAAEQALADRHVDDGAGALDGLAFLDLAVVAEDHDADVVDFEVERHAAHAVLELDHLAGLHVVEAVDAGDAVADRQHLADFGDFRLLAEILDLILQDRGDFCGADIHQPASFIACLIALSLVRSELSTMREPSLTVSPPMIAGSILTLRSTDLLAGDRLERALERLEMRVGQLLGDGDLGGHLALPAARPACGSRGSCRAPRTAGGWPPRTSGSSRRARRCRPCRARRRAPWLCSSAPNTGLRTSRCRSGLSAIMRVEFVEIGLHRIDGLGVERELEQRARIAARHAGYGRIFACHVERALEVKSAGSAPAPGRRRKPLDFKGIFRFRGPSPNPAKIARLRNISILAVQHFRVESRLWLGFSRTAETPIRPGTPTASQSR